MLEIIIFTTFIHPILGFDFSASVLLDSMMMVMQPASPSVKMEQEIIGSAKIKRFFNCDYFSENKGDDIWVYPPRIRRVRKLASHAKKQKA